MPKSRTAIVYGAVFAGATGSFLLVRFFGKSLVAPDALVLQDPSYRAAPQADMTLAQVLLALVVILVVARALGAAFRLIGQPRVIGEMIAGILLGPSLLGRILPEVSAYVFPSTILPLLSVIAQIGVILYMFLVGIRLDTKLLRRHLGTSIAISQASIVAPFLLGAALALWLYPVLSTSSVSFTEFALFMAVAMSVTAFPVLARILTDRHMETSRIGTIALASAAAGDVTAWCLLALVVSVARARPSQAILTVALTAGFVALIFFLVRPAIRSLAARHRPGGSPPSDAIVVLCVALLLAALATERIGTHGLFGAFLIGLVVPHDSALAGDVRGMLENPVALFLLPVFFAFTGLRTQIDLVHGYREWFICILIIGLASAGKFGGSFIAARVTGSDWRQAASLGVLMNTRGLMELIVLNIGLDLGVISPTLFTMLVLMAVVTTVATTPILQAVSPHASAQPLKQ
jgi:Kef-type K+ transport system membrane component KefB